MSPFCLMGPQLVPSQHECGERLTIYLPALSLARGRSPPRVHGTSLPVGLFAANEDSRGGWAPGT